MTKERKSEPIAKLVSILSELIEVDFDNKMTEVSRNTVEMLTIKECTEAVRDCLNTLSASSSSRKNFRLFAQVCLTISADRQQTSKPVR